ncbi:MAG: monovalent cation/H(+) antiporter subunit G [Chloroflexi bacterium]|nr:monovalent cation/H(+) antiporter subunit G [Chloroflexota bacterium]
MTLGASLVLAGAALATQDAGVGARVLAGIAFLFLTSPITAHVIARAGWRTLVEPVVWHQDEFETEPEARRIAREAGANRPGLDQ